MNKSKPKATKKASKKAQKPASRDLDVMQAPEVESAPLLAPMTGHWEQPMQMVPVTTAQPSYVPVVQSAPVVQKQVVYETAAPTYAAPAYATTPTYAAPTYATQASYATPTAYATPTYATPTAYATPTSAVPSYGYVPTGGSGTYPFGGLGVYGGNIF
jgi:hypothetical protein